MNIIGISAFYHDAAACLISNGKIIAAAQEERFTRKKHDPSYPQKAIEFVLKYSNFTILGKRLMECPPVSLRNTNDAYACIRLCNCID